MFFPILLLQALLTSTSKQLQSTVSGASLSDVTVLLPSSWRDTECVADVDLGGGLHGDVVLPEGFERADFSVGGGAHPVFGPGPRAVGQFGPCGQAARGGVRIPAEVLVRAENVSKQDGENKENN